MNNGHPPTLAGDESTPTADAVLVRRFVNCRDESAFAELVARYRGLVYGVCQRVLHHRQDVEDAFQAAFLVLARDAAEIRSRESIAAWLYGVAHRIALNARAKKSRRRETTLSHETETMGPPNPFNELAERSELQALDEELNQLPEKYREPLVLHYVMNRTAPQIAEELALSQTAVEGRLKRGRNRLRKQLARRGVGLTAILPVLQLCQSTVEAAVSESLVSQTVQAGLSFTSSHPAGHSHPVYSNEAADLAAKEIGTMTTSSLGTFTVVALSATVVIGLAIGVAGQTPPPGRADSTGLTNFALDQDKSQKNRSTAIPVIRLAALKHQNVGGIGDASGGIGSATSPKKSGAKAGPQTFLDYKSHTQTEQKILAELDKPTQIDFIQISLKDAVDFLSEMHTITIMIDEKTLKDEGIATDTPITLSLKGVRLKSVLRIMLNRLGLDYVLKNEVLQITTRTAAEEMMETRVYGTKHLKGLDAKEIVKMIEKSIQPDSWNTAKGGGKGSITPLPSGLVVTNNQRVHEKITDLLQQLGRLTPTTGRLSGGIGGGTAEPLGFGTGGTQKTGGNKRGR